MLFKKLLIKFDPFGQIIKSSHTVHIISIR